MKHPISPDTSGLYEKIWNFVREQLSVRYPFFRRLLWNFSFQESSETSSAGTDGRVIYFCPNFLIKTFQDDPDTLEKLFLHMLYHCLFLHLILEIPSDVQRWNRACDLAVYRLIRHEKKEYRPAILYSQNPELPETCAMDDHQFWKQADRKKLLEQMKNLWNNSYGTGGFGLYGSDGRGTSPGSLQEEISLREKHRYDFHRFLRHFAVHREELHTDTDRSEEHTSELQSRE